jgi:molybdopterin-guanine dinucleotide biosynthesis protein A
VLNDQSQSSETRKVLSDITCVFDEHKNRGALAGIHAALKNAKSEWIFVLACDLPLITAEVTSKLAEKLSEIDSATAAIVPRQCDGRLQPLCALYKTRICFPVIEKLFDSNESVSVRDLIASIPHNIIDAAELDSKNPALVFLNVNEPRDLEILVEARTQ